MSVAFKEFPLSVQEAHTEAKSRRIKHAIENIKDILESKQGSVTMVTGPMMSGKSSFMFEFRQEISDKDIYYFQPQVNTREKNIDSREYTETIEAEKTERSHCIARYLKDNKVNLDGIIVCIDEVQFYDEDIVNVVEYLKLEGAHVVLCGLDMDFRGEPFEFSPIEIDRYNLALELLETAGVAHMIKRPKNVGHLMALANHVVKLSARTCEGYEATHTKKKSTGNSKEVVEVGDDDIYEPVTANNNPGVAERINKFKLRLNL